MTSSQLIPISPGIIGNLQCLTVDGRTLHSVLGVKRDFSNWIKGRIQKYGFAEGQDFEIDSPVLANQKNGRGGDRRSQEYTLEIGMGKELCMVENNEAGRVARRYFIECERKLMQQSSPQSLAAPAARASTGPERAPVRAMVRAWSLASGQPKAVLQAQVKARFRLGRLDELPVSRIPDVLAFLQEKLDALHRALPAPAPHGCSDAVLQETLTRLDGLLHTAFEKQREVHRWADSFEQELRRHTSPLYHGVLTALFGANRRRDGSYAMSTDTGMEALHASSCGAFRALRDGADGLVRAVCQARFFASAILVGRDPHHPFMEARRWGRQMPW